MKFYRIAILFLSLALIPALIHAQDAKKALAKTELLAKEPRDTVPVPVTAPTPKTLRPKHDPHIATLRSAIIPGWGQAYNREYWKIPIVYGILSIPTILYFYNNSYYKKTKFAYEARYKALFNSADTADIARIAPELKNLDIISLETYRNSFRRDRDYSILWFLAAWGLQVADATVFAHLRDFDVSDDLSMQVHPSFNPVTKTPALTLNLQFRSPMQRKLFDAR
ncbi:MAG TPA: DUF5683 domain-containing protein [Sediminibacterium sp.]|nr:DUF5683 domain-containing protein [Sediminibacterium sp.]